MKREKANLINKGNYLLEEIENLETPVGIRYERLLAPREGSYRFSKTALLCLRGASKVKVRTKSTNVGRSIDSRQFTWVPGNMSFLLETDSAIQDLLIILISDEYFDSMIQDNGLTASDRALLQTDFLTMNRTKWLDDILDRYFFERILNRYSPPGCTFFLEKQIINETARIIFREKMTSWSTKSEEAQIGFDAALHYIDVNLFEKLDLEKIANVAKLSESSLLRYFKKALGTTPYAYIKDRRLEEAYTLLQRSQHSVSDIAMLVGYEDFSAFSKAFRSKFRKKPSEILTAP
jgi:AraC-like DNA-binding protein